MGIAVALLVVVLERRAGIAGGVLLVLAWGSMVQAGLTWLVGRLPSGRLGFALSDGLLTAPLGLALFAGTAPLTFAAVQAPSQGPAVPQVPDPLTALP